jgi:hypothetical protein
MVAMAKPKPKPGRPKGPAQKPQVISMRGNLEWRAWLNELADHAHMPASTLIDQALIRFAREAGFQKPMPKR